MSDIGWNGRWDSQHGMTLRDYFAGQALAGRLADGTDKMKHRVAEDAYAYADAMLAERTKSKVADAIKEVLSR
jgi:phage gp46-like protein